MTPIDVIGIGVSTVDFLSLVDHFPSGEEVQRAIEMTIQGGGPVATAIVTLAKLGCKAAMLDVIGDVWKWALIRQDFEQVGVITDYIKVETDRTSATAWVLVVRANGARSIVYFPGNVSEFSPADLPRRVIESAKFLHVNGRHWEACIQAIEWAREANVQVSFDGGAHRYRPQMAELLSLTDICIVARDFATKFAQTDDVQKTAEAILGIGPKVVVITDGVKGSWIHSVTEEPFHQPAYLLPHVVDTTGCGDSYHGAFLFGMLKGWNLSEIASFASAVAAFNTQHLGGRKGLPTLEEARSFLATHAPAVST